MIHRSYLARPLLSAVSLFLAGIGSGMAGSALPPLHEVLDSKLDLWGEAAMRQTNGAIEDLHSAAQGLHKEVSRFNTATAAGS